MSVLLKDLLEEIGSAICNANSIIEATALEHYITQGYQKSDTNDEQGDIFAPLTFNMTLQEGGEVQKIPISALMHNTTMRLEQVDMKLKFKLFEEDGAVKVLCTSDNMDADSLDEMTLQFKNSASTEGTSRITDNHMKKI